MVTYAEFTALSVVAMEESDFNKIEQRVVDLLSSMCGNKWNAESEVCKKAVVYQIEFVQLNGGITSWVNGSKGKVASHSYSIGGESESENYETGSDKQYKFNNLLISPLAVNLLESNGFFSSVERVRVC